jgi:hypothetical protein
MKQSLFLAAPPAERDQAQPERFVMAVSVSALLLALVAMLLAIFR